MKKTYKLLINGAFPRSESGRSYEVANSRGSFLANVAQASRKDVRDAVVAARAAQSKWWKHTAYNRGQVIYRLAEMAESRRDELADHVGFAEGLKPKGARAIVSRVDRPDRLVRGVDRQGRSGARLVQPGRRTFLQLLDPEAQRRGGRGRRADVLARGVRGRGARANLLSATRSSQSRARSGPRPRCCSVR